VPNKIDLPDAAASLAERTEFYTRRRGYAAVAPISALAGTGVAELKSALFERLPEGEPWLDPDLSTTQTERFFVAELIREALLERVEKELPFTSAVHVRDYAEEETGRGPLLRVIADIVVDRDSQKGIVVGRSGAMIKAIGTAARAQIEALLGARVFLDLQVKARPGWREDRGFLTELESVEAIVDAAAAPEAEE